MTPKPFSAAFRRLIKAAQSSKLPRDLMLQRLGILHMIERSLTRERIPAAERAACLRGMQALLLPAPVRK